MTARLADYGDIGFLAVSANINYWVQALIRLFNGLNLFRAPNKRPAIPIQLSPSQEHMLSETSLFT